MQDHTWHGTEVWAHVCSHYSGPLIDGPVVSVQYGYGLLVDGPILAVRHRIGQLVDGPILAVRTDGPIFAVCYGSGPFLVAHNDKPVYVVLVLAHLRPTF
jgi:hypothetical protein